MSCAAVAALNDAAARQDRTAVQAEVESLDYPAADPDRLVATAVTVKEAGFVDLAEQVLVRLLSHHPDHVQSRYELAWLYRVGGHQEAAIDQLLWARGSGSRHRHVAHLLATLLMVVGAHDEAEALAPDLDGPGPAEAAEWRVLRDFGRYVADHPRARAQHILQTVRRRNGWIDAAEVARLVNAAMDEGRGFSLIRMGDGEGPFTRVPGDAERYPHLDAWMRREWATLLFGADFDPHATGYFGLADTLNAVIGRADVVGVPYASWVDHEYNIASQRGVPGLLNVHRALLASPGPRPVVCNQRIHIELHEQGLLEPILRRSPSLGVISCISSLPDLLRERFGVADVELFKIPGEKYSESLRTDDAMAGVHFPFVFWDIIRRLSRPQQGRVFLIAAGTLAKFYADTIKAHGGIALDIGSLVDGWTRIPSRPGYGAELAL